MMVERTDEWPRVHSCLKNWCPYKGDDCWRCDAVIAALDEGTRKRMSDSDEALLIKPVT